MIRSSHDVIEEAILEAAESENSVTECSLTLKIESALTEAGYRIEPIPGSDS